MWEHLRLVPELEDPPGGGSGNAPPPVFLPGESPVDRGAWRVFGVARSWTTQRLGTHWTWRLGLIIPPPTPFSGTALRELCLKT